MKGKITLTLKPNTIRDTFIRDLRHTHISYVAKNGKAYNRKEKYKKDLTTCY